MEKYLPTIITALIGFLTIGVSLWLGLAKQKMDVKSIDRSAENDLRDDLLHRNETLIKQIEYKDQQIAARDAVIDRKNEKIELLQQTLNTLQEKIVDVNILVKQRDFDIKGCNDKVTELSDILKSFERKVYYIREIAKDTTTGETEKNE